MEEEKLKKISEFLGNVLTETGFVSESLLNNEKGIKANLIMTFCCIEVFSSYWDLYKNPKASNNSKRMKTWIDKFLLESNQVKEFPHYEKITSENIYNLRCNLFHFFSGISIQDKKKGKQSKFEIITTNGDERYPDNKNQIVFKILKSQGKIVISDYSLKLLTFKAAKKMIEIINTENNKEGLSRIYKKVREEGDECVSLELL